MGTPVQALLDAGADSLLVPRVTSIDSATASAARMVFGPAGERGLGFTSRAGRWGLMPLPDYLEHGDQHDLADLMGVTRPFRPRLEAENAFTNYLREVDVDFYSRLEKSGFQLWQGEDESGFFMAYYRRAASYYIDVGGSELIANGEVKVQHGEIAGITEDGLRMADGTFLPADVIVCATGYRPMDEWVSQLISPKIAEKVGACWGLGSGTQGVPAHGRVNCAICGSPRRRTDYGFRAAI